MTDHGDDIQPYGVELTMADIVELTTEGELHFQYFTADGENDVEVVLYYDDDDEDGGSGHEVTTTLR